MIRGLYISSMGMNVQRVKVEGISNNLSNISTPGYKREGVAVQSFPQMFLVQKVRPQFGNRLILPGAPKIIGTMETGVRADTFTDFAPGAVQETGNPYDLMISGPGFFSLSVPSEGDPDRACYTRKGTFKVGPEGYLVVNGYRVLGEAGAIKVGDEGFTVAPDGTVESGGVPVDKLRLVEFDDAAALRKETDGVFVNTAGAGRAANESTVRQGFLEMANVNAIDQMADLVSVTRAYEANQRLIQSHDELLAKAVNQIGSLR